MLDTTIVIFYKLKKLFKNTRANLINFLTKNETGFKLTHYYLISILKKYKKFKKKKRSIFY